MSRDFFAKIDAKLQDQEAKAASVQEASDLAKPLADRAIAESVALAREHSAQLSERGITMTVKASAGGVTVELRYLDGGHRNFTYVPSLDNRRMEGTTNYTNDDGKTYNSTDGSGDPVADWAVDQYRVRLERVIDDYVFYASRHRGVV